MRLTLALIFPLLSSCSDLQPNQGTDRTGSMSTAERAALYEQALAGARLSWERYIAAERPVLQQKFRQEYPTMTEADLDLLVNDALEKGLRQEAGRKREKPPMRPFNNCMTSPLGSPNFPNCY